MKKIIFFLLVFAVVFFQGCCVRENPKEDALKPSLPLPTEPPSVTPPPGLPPGAGG